MKLPPPTILVVLTLLFPACTLFTPDSPTFEPRERPHIEADTIHEAALDDGAVNPRDGTPYRAFEIDLEADTAITVDAESDDFAPALSLFGPDGSLRGVSTASADGDINRLIRPVSSTGPHLIVVSGHRADATGDFDLIVETIDPPRETLSFPGETTGIVFGDSAGEQARSTHLLELDDTTPIEMAVDADGFVPSLAIIDRQTEDVLVETTTESGQSTSLVTELPPGDYELRVSRQALGPDGYYELRTRAADRQLAEAFTAGEPFAGTLPPTHAEAPETVSKTGERLSVELDEAAILDARLYADAFSGMLVLADKAGIVVARADTDRVEAADARLIRPLDPGSYSLWVVTAPHDPSGQGPYRLETDLREPPTSEPLSLDTTVEGTLTDGSAIEPSRHSFVEYYEIELDEPTRLRIEMTSREFDAYLIVEDDAGEIVAENDDAHIGTTDARIEREFDPGTYRVKATTFTPDTLGHFELEVIRTIP